MNGARRTVAFMLLGIADVIEELAGAILPALEDPPHVKWHEQPHGAGGGGTARRRPM